MPAIALPQFTDSYLDNYMWLLWWKTITIVHRGLQNNLKMKVPCSSFKDLRYMQNELTCALKGH